MRLPRRTSAQSQQGITQELQSVRAGAITPAERARETTAKYGAIAAGAEAIGDVATVVGGVRQKAQQAKDEITYQSNENNFDMAYADLQNDPNVDKPVQDDGSSTADYYSSQVDEIIKQYKSGLNDIVDPEARKRAEAFVRDRETKMRISAAGDMGVIESRVAEGAFIENMNKAMDAGNMEGARTLLTTAYNNGLVDAGGREKWSDAIEKTGNQAQAQALVDEVNEAYSISEDDGNARLSELIKDTDIDQQVRDMAIDGAEEKRVEWGKAREEETKQAEVQSILSYGDDKARASAGMMSYEQADAAFESGRYGDGTGAASRRNQIYTAITSAMGKKETELDIRSTIESGRFILDNKKNRDGLSLYEQDVTAGMDSGERITAIGDISRTAGTASTHTSNTLNLSSKAEPALAQNLKLYRELTSDKTTMPTLHLTPEAASSLEDASTLMDSGLGAQEAANIAYANGHPDEAEKTARTETWRSTTVDTANTSFTDLVDSDFYEEPGFGDVDEPPVEMAVEYGTLYKAVFMQTGNEVAAKNVADTAIKRNWVMTNFNSADSDEYTIERNGLPGDVHRIRAGVIREFEDERFKTRAADGTYKSTKVDADKITFEAVETDGERRWGVLHDGVPLVRVTDDGIEVATFVMDEDRLAEYKEKTATTEATETRLQEIKHETNRLTNLTEESPYRTVTPGFTAKRKGRIKSLEKEQARLESELPKTVVHF